jgi:hypothetical protein
VGFHLRAINALRLEVKAKFMFVVIEFADRAFTSKSRSTLSRVGYRI